jgi:hypothetical protein
VFEALEIQQTPAEEDVQTRNFDLSCIFGVSSVVATVITVADGA